MTQERHNWLVDSSHTSTIYGSVRISGSGMAAREATEMGLIRSVAFIAKATHRTPTAGVARIDVDHAHTRLCGLVADKRSELPKSPRVARTTLLASNRDSFSKPVQIFERECLTLRARLLHHRLADAVVDIFLKAVFAPSIPFQSPAGAAGIRQLQPPPMVIVTLTHMLDVIAAIRLAVRISGNIHNAEIDAEIADWFISLGRDLRLRDAQIPDTCTPQQFRAADLPGRIVQITTLEVAQDKLPDHAARQGVEADPIQTHQAIGAGIVANATVGGERRAGGMSIRARRAHRLSRLVSGTACQLCAQAIVDAGRAIRRCDGACFCL